METPMPHVTDRDEIRRALRIDPVWAAYPLGDLAPPNFSYCSWHRSGDAFALVFRRYKTPILWAAGEGSGLAEILQETGDEPELDLQVREESLPALAKHYQWQHLRTMTRMAVRPGQFRPVAANHRPERLFASSLYDVTRLYDDGLADGTCPDYFFPAMLEEGVFFGVRAAGELVSVAGTHLVAAEEAIAAVGNVYTRSDCRGRGYGASVTSAVIAELFAMGVGVAALNVKVENTAASRVYQSLGFHAHCTFREGIAAKRR
jgi:ribosomal protein S18 acetylase RimI-like enzyme